MNLSGIVTISLLLMFNYAGANISDACISCLAKVELGIQGLCNEDQGSPSCGVYQMKKPYWVDCYRPMNSLEECAFNEECAKQCIRDYTARYAHMCKAQLGKENLSCEDYGRMHNGGGPSGCSGQWTLHYLELMRRKCTEEELNSNNLPSTHESTSTAQTTIKSTAAATTRSTARTAETPTQRWSSLRRLRMRRRN